MGVSPLFAADVVAATMCIVYAKHHTSHTKLLSNQQLAY